MTAMPRQIAPAAAPDTAALDALAQLLHLAPRVWPGVAVEAEWNTALIKARDVLKQEKKRMRR